MRVRSLPLVLVAGAALVAGPADAQAGRSQLSVFQDDAALVLGTASERERTLDDVTLLGADTIHSVVFWHKVAPRPLSTRRPAGFRGDDPAAYPPELWDRYDALVRGANIRGIDLLLSPSSPMPAWASRCRGSLKLRKTCRPDLTQFKRFVEALGRRYSGSYSDENEGRGVLPRVSRWSVWNEPNQGGWLQPQFGRSRGRLVPRSPALYRDLVRAAIKGLRESGHGSDDILLGETAPLGRRTGPPSTRPMAPGDFLRGVLCLDRRGRALTGRARRDLGCDGFPRLRVTGFSHHPYTRGGSQPPTARGGRNEITISSSGRLKSIIRAAGRRGRVPRGLPIFYTEFGFQTNPPDTLFGVSLEKQARWLNHSDFLAWRDPLVRSVAQYEMRDEAPLASFQTGLRFRDGTAKPSFAAYRLPIWVRRAGSRLRVWGQVRPAEDDAREVVEVQHAPPGSDEFTTVAEADIDLKGFVDVPVARRAGTWRLSWTPRDGGPTVTSRVAGVGS